MRMAIAAVFSVVMFAAVSGCGGRPDPRENPNFDEEAYSDPNAAMKQMQGAEVKR